MTARIALTAGLACVLLAAGCGDGGGAATELVVSTMEYQFDPDTWTAAADTDVAITLTNDGTIEHEWAVLSESIEDEEQFEEDLVLFEVEAVPAGQSETATFSLPAGTYQVICGIEGHFNSGMEGTLTVE